MAKQLNVNLAFTADTGKAKAQIQELQSLLSKIAYTGSTNNLVGDAQKDLQAASSAAKELQFHLNNAFNATTGKFDLSLLDKSLKTSGTNIQNLSTQLLSAGSTGQQAFVKLAQSISLADQPMFKINNKLQEFATTMKNTVRWQLSSSMLHGFMGAVQSAYGYAQNLNKSLTDIRIVTGYNTDQMAQFAEQANKAAKALSTTTTDYTNASLIYFQQGLTDAEVQERTNVTVKMANATGTSAQVVSDQMTAIWNNFDDGSKSLEYYADVMTALGAATASSTDEISQGLQKFAAVSETVGLSYEYATAALTAIMSNTRESADVVGTALKTLFARIQGLQLGETLDDGTDLNKYSQALEKVGISIYESNGELKAMDNILDEMATKWDTMGKAEQTALAQTVAGVRQYTQLVALMENWDNGDADSFQANLKTISGAEGTLDEQAEIYAQSWEAAEKRVRAAAEGIYQSLLDDNFFISINNGFANLLGGLDAFIDGAGGLKTVLIGLSGIILSNFANKIPDALDTFKYNLEIVTKGTQAAYTRIKADMDEANSIAFTGYNRKGEKVNNNLIDENSSTGIAVKQANALTAARTKLALVSDKMSAAEKQMAEASLSFIQQQQEEVIVLKQENEELQKNIDLQLQSMQKGWEAFDSGEIRGTRTGELIDVNTLGLEADIDFASMGGDIATALNTQLVQALENAKNQFNDFSKASIEGFNLITASGNGFSTALRDINLKISEIKDSKMDFKPLQNELMSFIKILPQGIQNIESFKKAINTIKNAQNIEDLEKGFQNLQIAMSDIKIEGRNVKKVLEELNGKKLDNLYSNMSKFKEGTIEVTEKITLLEKILADFQPTHIVRMSEAFGALGGLMGNVVSIGNSVVSIFTALSNPDLNGWEKFSTVLSGVSMIIPGVMSMLKSYATLVSYLNTSLATQATLEASLAISQKAAALTGKLRAQATQEVTEETLESVAALILEQGILDKKIGKTGVLSAVTAAYNSLKKEGTAVTLGAIISHIAENAVIDQKNTKLSLQAVLLTIIKALMGDWVAIGKVLIGVLAAIGVGLAIMGLEKWIVTQKEANEAIAEASKKYAEEKQKLDELNNSLEETQKRIEELQSKDSLSLVEQEELNKLLEQEASLKRQIALQEQLAQTAKEESANTYENNSKKASSWMSDAPKKESVQQLWDDSIQGFWADEVTPEEYLTKAKELYLNNDGTIKKGMADYWADAQETYNDWIKTYDESLKEFIKNNKENLETLTAGYEDWYDVYGQNDEAETLKQATLISNANKLLYKDYDNMYLNPVDNIFQASTDQKDKNIINTLVKDLEDGIVDADPAAIAKKFSDTFKQSLLRQGILPDDYAQHLIDEYTRAASVLKGEVSLEDLMNSEDFNLEDLDILAHLQLTGEEDLDELLAKIKAYKDNTIEVEVNGFNLSKWTEQFNTIKDLKIGDTIDPEQWSQLDANMQQFFTKTIEGEYALIESTDTLIDKLKESLSGEIQSQQDQIELGQQAGGKYLSNIGESALSNGVVEGSYNKQMVEAQLNFLKSQNKDTSIYEDKLFDENGDFKTVKAEDIGVFDDLATAATTAKVEFDALNGSLTENQEAAALSAESIGQLDTYLNNGIISIENYEEAFNKILLAEAEAEGFEGKELLNYAANLQKSLNLTEKQSKKLALTNMKLNKGLSNLSDNYGDLQKELKKVNGDFNKLDKTSPSVSKAFNKIRESLADILDVDSSTISDDFIEATIEAGELEKIINGDTEALLSLQKRAANKILIDTKIENEQVQNQFNNLTTALQNMANMSPVEIQGKLNDADFLEKCSNLVNAAGMTASQAQAYFDALGYEAEVETIPHTTTTASHFEVPEFIMSPNGDLTAGIESVDTVSTTTTEILSIKSINKKSSGAGSSSGSKGGGGGGSAPKRAEKKSSSDKERYHTITNQLEDLKDEYDEISDAADRAFGQDKLDAIDDQIDKTDELIDKQEEYLDAIKQNYKIDKATMIESWDGSTGKDNKSYFEKYFGKLPEIQFDVKGNISNYDELQDKMIEIYNKATTKWTEDSEEWQVFEKKYEEFEKYIEQYEETYDLLREEEAAYQELMNQRLDLQLEKVEYGIELKLNISEDDLSLLEYQFNLLEDKAFASAERIATSTQQANNIYNQILTNRQGLEEALGLSLSPGEIAQLMEGDMSVLEGQTFTEAQIDVIKEYRDNLLDLNTELIEIQKQIEEQVLEAFDEWHEKLDEGMDKFSHYSNMLEGYKNIIDIVGKDVLGIDNEHIAKLSQTQVDNSINQLSSAREAYESYSSAAEEADRKMQESQNKAAEARAAGNEELAKSYDEDAKFWENTYNEMDASAREAQEELMDTWGNTLESIVTQFELSIERAVDAFNDAIYQLGGLEGLSNDFARAKERDDLMLDDYQKIYELSKLTRDINNTIDDTDNIAGKQKLKKLLEQINKLQEDGVEMSQYDLEYLQAEYDLRLAELELEEAQNAKDTVRLSRDNEGNWSYIYTQNTDVVDAAQQKYEDALYAMQDLSSNYIDEMSEKLIATSQEMQEALASLRVEDFASLEDYYAEVDRVQRLYQEQMAVQEAELNKAINNNKNLYENDWKNYSEATGYKISTTENFVTAFKDSMLGTLIGSEEATSNFGAVVGEATTTLVNNLLGAATDYYRNLDTAMEAAGTSTNDFANTLSEDVERIKTESEEAAEYVQEMANSMDEAISQIMDSVHQWQEDYGHEIDKILAKNIEIINSFNDMIKALSGDQQEIDISYSIKSNSKENETTSSKNMVEIPDTIVSGATGMYTGNWGSSEGKLAILHEKELLLNQDDTSNMLSMLELTRYLMQIIDINAKQLSQGMGALQATAIKDDYKEILEQSVSIQAEFPNVVDHNEIEQAFNNLINTASQYANRK